MSNSSRITRKVTNDYFRKILVRFFLVMIYFSPLGGCTASHNERIKSLEEEISILMGEIENDS